MQLGSPNLTYKCSTMSGVLEILLFWGQKVKGLGHNVGVGIQTDSNIAAAALVMLPVIPGEGFCTLASAGFF